MSGALIGIFMTGSVAVAASIVRLNALYIYTVSKDVSYDAIYVGTSRGSGRNDCADTVTDSPLVAGGMQYSHHYGVHPAASANIQGDFPREFVRAVSKRGRKQVCRRNVPSGPQVQGTRARGIRRIQ